MRRPLCLLTAILGLIAGVALAEDPFLAFDGSDYLATDYYPTPETRLDVDFALTDDTAQQFLAYAGVEAENDLHLRVYVNGKQGYSWSFDDEKNFTPYTDAQGKRIPVALGRRQVASIDGFRGEVAFGPFGGAMTTNAMTTVRKTKTRTYPLLLFYNRFTGLRTKGRLYGLRIWEKGVLLHDYRPVKEGEEMQLVDGVTGRRLRTIESQNPYRTIVTKPGALKGVDGHVQGIACSDDAIYLSFITTLVKLDWKGNVLKIVPARRHMGDIAYHNGKIYGCLGKTKDPNVGLGGTAYIQVFDTDLNLIGEKRTPDAPGIDGIGILGNHVFVGGGTKGYSRAPHLENLIVKYDGKLEPVAKAWVDYGVKTNHGIQNIAIAEGKVWCFFYTSYEGQSGCAVLDTDLKLITSVAFTGGNGVDALPPRFGTSKAPRFLVCDTLYAQDDSGPRAQLRFVTIGEAALPL